MTKLLLAWDIDGTLVTTGTNHTRNALTDALGEVLGRPIAANFSMSGMTDYQIMETLLANNNAPLSFATEALSRLDRNTTEFVGYKEYAVPGAKPALVRSHNAGHLNVLLTGNTPLTARCKLAAAGYDVNLFDWDLSAFGNTTPNRAHLAKKIADLASSRNRTAVAIGDTPADSVAATTASLLFCAVATGNPSYEDLANYPHDLLIHNLVTGRLAFETFLEALVMAPSQQSLASVHFLTV